jgi:hypothetical protein
MTNSQAQNSINVKQIAIKDHTPSVSLQFVMESSYNLPKTPFSFTLRIENKSASVLHIQNPLQTLLMTLASKRDGIIDFPKNSPRQLVHTNRHTTGFPMPISPTFARMDGKILERDSDTFKIASNSILEIGFRCDPIIGKILLEKQLPEISISFVVSLPNLDDVEHSVIFRTEDIPLSLPKPKYQRSSR